MRACNGGLGSRVCFGRGAVMAKHLIDGETFATDKTLHEKCSAILHRGSQPTADEERFLAVLLARHPDADQKIGVGLRRIYIGDGPYGTPALWLERIDGTSTDWSFKTCIKPTTHAAKVNRAFRVLVDDHVIEFRHQAFARAVTIPCAITGEPVAKLGSHVDHRPPDTFQSLMGRFLAQRSLKIENIEVLPGRDGDVADRLIDAAIGEAWIVFHRAHAVLQITSARANMVQGTRAP